jgi:poly(3-hydroxybutyrate) depolymerase
LLFRVFALIVFSVLLACSGSKDTLPALGVDVDKTSVSGLSAGAYMAGQLQLAHSENIRGAAIVAGGPFGCAENQSNSVLPSVADNLAQAFGKCLNGKGIPDPKSLVDRSKQLAQDGKIDPLARLSKDRVFLFSGGQDHIVATSVVEVAKQFYVDVGIPQESIALITRGDAGHAFLTTDTGNACGVTASPFVNDCDYDQAGAILSWIYGDLNAPSEKASGKFLVFDQTPFAKGVGNGMSREGVVYVPKACAEKSGCRLHIVLHGCEQDRDQVGMTFIQGSGFARWADTNRLVILFPQVEASPLNPKACWDWWGYTGKEYLTKNALQIAAMWRMVQRLAGAKTAS